MSSLVVKGLEKLPDCLNRMIALFLHPKDAEAFSTTCKRWSSIINESYWDQMLKNHFSGFTTDMKGRVAYLGAYKTLLGMRDDLRSHFPVLHTPADESHYEEREEAALKALVQVRRIAKRVQDSSSKERALSQAPSSRRAVTQTRADAGLPPIDQDRRVIAIAAFGVKNPTNNSRCCIIM